MKITRSIKFLFLALSLFAGPLTAWSKTINLSTLTAKSIKTVSNGDVLTGTQTVDALIQIASGATVTLSGVTISSSGLSGTHPGLICVGNATIILKDGTTNVVTGFGTNCSAIYLPAGNTLTIKGETAGTGSLTATGGGAAAGIGAGSSGASSSYRSCGHIVIQGGHITARGGYGAGIGAGQFSSAGNITISGGVVNASSSSLGAGIGSGNGKNGNTLYASTCGNILISGGTVTATGGQNAAGIGSGQAADCGTITIVPFASVTATKGANSHSIGKGYSAKCGTVTINGKTGYISDSPYTFNILQEGTHIRLGSYSGEHVDWFAARNNSNGWMMLCKYALKNMKFGSNSTYTQSNIYKWLDSDAEGTFEDELGLTAIERSLVKTVNLSSSGGDGTDRFIIPHRTNEQPNGSPYTKSYYIYNQTSRCEAYWLREARDGTNPRVIRASDETVTARYSNPGNNNGVRPMFYLNTDALLTLSHTGSGTEDDPYVFQPRYDVDLDVAPKTGAAVSATVVRGSQTLFTANLPIMAVAGDVISITATPANGYTFKDLAATSGSSAVSLSGEGATRSFTMPAAGVTVKVSLSLPKDEEEAYLIRSAADWELFCDDVHGGNTYSGATVKLTADISGVTTRTSNNIEKPFSGTFDGQGHKFGLNINVTSADATAAPFGYINGATIRNLHITGSETSAGMRIASIAGFAANSTISNCRSDVALSSRKASDIDGGAFVARTESGTTVTLDGCAFTGSITYSNAAGYEGGGMVGWRKGTVVLNNCLFAPSAINVIKYQAHNMFIGNGSETINNCYYNDVAAASGLTVQGRKAYACSSDPGDMGDLVGDYGVLKAYTYGISFDSRYYVAVTDFSLTAATIFGESGYVASFYDGSRDYRLIEKAKAYTMSSEGGKIVFHQIGDDGCTIPRGTAVVIVASQPDVMLRILNSTTVTPREGNILKGTDVDIDKPEGTVYVLGKVEDVLDFYTFTGSTIPAGKAYFVVNE